MEVKLYEKWMETQVLQLFSNEYGRTLQELRDIHANFYDNEFQNDKCIRVAALDGDIVVGFQTLFYWPYIRNNKVYRSYQSGNSIVHSSYRGKGIFQKLLQYLDDHHKELQIDFLMGFPVEASYKSFIKNTWDNPFDLIWYVKIINPIAFLFPIGSLNNQFNKSPEFFISENNDDAYRLFVDDKFHAWRSGFTDPKAHFYFNFEHNGNKLTFGLKYVKRSRFLRELVIGEIRTSSYDERFLRKALQSLIKKARRTLCVSMLSIALVENNRSSVLKCIKKYNFIRTNKKIYFITKNYDKDFDLKNPDNWELYRGDIDSW